MKSLLSPSLDEIRVALQQFAAKVTKNDKQSDRHDPYRVPTFEVFEQRTVLSAAGLSAMPVDDLLGQYEEVAAPAPQLEVLQQAFTINSITLRINGNTDVTIGPQAEPLSLRGGDTFQVIGIDYVVSQLGDGLEGVIAAEGYLHKLDDTHGPGAVDYGDGRFGDPPNADLITAGDAWHDGLEGTWTVDEGWDRVSLVLIRYFGNESETVANFSVQLQVEEPDFTMNKKSLKKLEKQTFRVGETAYVKVEWGNAGKGRYHNYLEMDVHHVADMENPVWVGVSVATLGKKESVSLVLENDNPNDTFTQYWTPQQAGLHRLLVAVDPEDAWQEKKESDNRVEIWVTVEEAHKEERGHKAKGHGGGRRIAHGSLLGPVPVASPDVAPPSSVLLGPPTIADVNAPSIADVNVLTNSQVSWSVADDLTSLGRVRDEFYGRDPGKDHGKIYGENVPVAEAVDRRSLAITSDAEQDRWRGPDRNGEVDDELADVDTLLSGDDLFDSISDRLLNSPAE